MRLSVILGAASAMYIWGMLYWGANPLPYKSWHQATDDIAAGTALRRHFPETGTYYIPAVTHEDATLDKLYRNGPNAFIHVTAATGRDRREMNVLWKGFVLYLAVAALLSLLVAKSAGFAARMRIVLIAALAASMMIHGGDAVWWYLTWPWKLNQAIYDVSAWAIGGAVLARFE